MNSGNTSVIKIQINYIIPYYSDPIYQLSKDERGLIARYRTLSKVEKQQAIELMGNLSKKDD